MLYLYPKNAVDFTNNGDPIRHSFDEHVIRDDGFYLTFNLLLDKEEEYKKVKKEMIVGAETPDGRNQFRVYDVKKKSTQVEVTAVQLMYDFDNKEVNPFSVKNASGAQIINRFKSSFKSTLGQFTMDSSVTELHDFTTNEEEDDTPSHNALEILNRITKRWDSELMLNGFDIRMIKRLGSKTDALLYEKKNISEFEDVSSVSGMATRIHATSKFTPEGKEDEVTLSVTVDSPLINEYAQIYEKSYVNNDAKTEAELIAWVKLKYSTENIDKPSRTITVETNIIDGTEINYGDDLVMKYLVHDVDEVIRCVGYDYDPIKNTYYSVTLGDWKDSFATTLTGGIVDATNQQLNQIKNNITYISMSANGKNRNAHGPDPVPNPINGDQWFYYELDRPDDVEYRVYQDGFWVKLDFFATKKEVEDVIDQADEDREATEQKLDQAVADAKAYTEKKANEFDTKFETETGAIRNEVAAGYTNAITVGKDYTDVKSAEFDAQLIVVKNDLVNTVLKADAAVLKADKAIEDAGFMQVDVDAAKQNSITALTTAQHSYDEAVKALNKATSVESITNTLSLNYDTLTKTVGLKVDKEVVNGISQTVDKHTLDIKANADGLKFKADSSLVSAIDKTVTNHTAELGVQAQAINARLTSTQVDSLVSAKGYVNQAQLTATSTQWNLALTQVSSDLSNLEIGGRNLWRGFNYDQEVTLANYNLTGSFSQFSNLTVDTSKEENLNVEFTISFWAKSPNGVTNLKIYNQNGNPRYFYFSKLLDTALNVDWKYYTYTFTNIDRGPTLTSFYRDRIEFYAPDKTGVVIKNVKVEKGQKATDWTPAPEDMATLEQFTTIDATVKGLQTTVGNKADKSQVTQLAGQVSSKVESSTYNSKMTQLDSAINLRVESGKLMSQLNINPEGILLQGKNIQLDGNVTMDTAFINKMKVYSLEAVYADIATLKTKVLTADVITSVHLKVDNALIDKLSANTAVINYLFTKKAMIDNVEAKSLSAIYADIATLRTKFLTADLITSTMLKSDTALIDKIFINDANVQRFTAKTAFINSVKAVEISADKINGGIFNAATMNVIGLNAGSITSGTLRGANLDLNLNTGMQTFYNPVSAGGNLVLTQGQIRFVRGGMGSRYINYHDEGIIITHGTENTGYTRNTSLHLQGDKAYLQFISNAGLTLQRLESDSIYLTAYVNDSFRVQRYYGTGEWRPVKARSFETSGTSNDMEIIENWIRTTNTNDTHIYIEPSRNGNIRVADRALKQYHAVEASNFKVSSERRFKSDINDFDNALSLLSSIKFHKYIKNGESEIGLITDEAPLQLLSKDLTTVDLYSLISLTGRSVQELTQITYSHDRFLNEHDKRLAVLEKENKLLKQKIEKLESAA